MYLPPKALPTKRSANTLRVYTDRCAPCAGGGSSPAKTDLATDHTIGQAEGRNCPFPLLLMGTKPSKDSAHLGPAAEGSKWQVGSTQ